MMERISKVWFRLTGGRPMKPLHYEFTDQVAGRGVFRFADRRDGTHWLSFGPWDRFRMRPIDHFTGEGR